MKKRIFAWVLLVGFVLLLINLLTFQYLLEQSLILYIIVAALFLMSNNKRKKR